MQGDDKQGKEKQQQAKENRKVDVDTFSAAGRGRRSASGKSCRVEAQKALSFQLSPIQLLHLAIHPRQMLTGAYRGQDPRYSVIGRSAFYSSIFVYKM